MVDQQGESFVDAVMQRVEESEAAHHAMYLMAQDLAAKADAAVGPAIARAEAAEATVALLRGALEDVRNELWRYLPKSSRHSARLGAISRAFDAAMVALEPFDLAERALGESSPAPLPGSEKEAQ